MFVLRSTHDQLKRKVEDLRRDLRWLKDEYETRMWPIDHPSKFKKGDVVYDAQGVKYTVSRANCNVIRDGFYDIHHGKWKYELIRDCSDVVWMEEGDLFEKNPHIKSGK